MVSLSYKQADPSYTVDSATRVTFPDFGSRWTACKDAAGRQTGRRPRIVSRIIVEECFVGWRRSRRVPGGRRRRTEGGSGDTHRQSGRSREVGRLTRI